MSTTSSSATTTLYVNGKPAQDELARLRADLDKYKKQLLDIAADPSKGLGSKEWDEARKKLKATETELNRVSNDVSNVTRALSRLDKATPGELRKYLRQLNKELASIERGSKAWDEQVKKIRAVKEELAKVNAETKAQSSLWERFAKKMFDWGAALQVVFSAITGITFTARKAVEAYAEMEQEMANVRKFTGMTAEQVEDLNEEFKRMDTRTSREGLNQLAQEAGRLGKSSKEDVLGFVRAADQINVALDDLGEGATLTLSKLTGLFGDEERYGTEQALLKVGSVINELSQNCSASAPYIAEFASRLGGTGAQAKMSVQQIMAYGAVLDSAQQKVESASTALSQVIVKLYRDPAKYAAAAGLDVKQFTELLKKDANEAVLTLLDTLHKAGGMDVLAPMFAEMGENGARSIQTLSVLAGKIDEVRAQQEVANQAFEEGTSVTKEFNVQNNTVQAGLEKAKKHFNEIAVQLGQQLLPVMRYAITSSSALMKVISGTVNFFTQHWRLIVSLTAGIAAYNVVVHWAIIQQKLWNAAVAIGNALMATGKVVVLAMKSAVLLLFGQIERARKAWIAMNAVMNTNPWAMLAAVIATVATALYLYTRRVSEAEAAQRALNKIKDDAREKMVDEVNKINRLRDAAKDERLSLDERREAVRKLNDIIPDYNAQLDATSGKYRENKKALDDYLLSLTRKYELEGAKEMLAELGKEKAAAQTAVNEAQKNVDAAAKAGRGYTYTTSWGAVGNTSVDVQEHAASQLRSANAAYNNVVAKEKAILSTYGVDLEKDAVSGSSSGGDATGGGGGGGSSSTEKSSRGGSKKTEDKFKAEKDWREQQIALAKIAYFKGETDYEQHQQRLEQIDMEYAEKLLERTDLTESERLDAQAKYWEAKNKLDKRAHAKTIADENEAYEDLRRQVQEDYLQNRISKKTYDMEMENIEFAHLRALTQLTQEGTEERRRAEETYRQRLVADQQKRHAAYLANEKAQRDQLDAVWDKYAEDEESKREKMVEETKKTLKLAYEMRKALIMNDDSLSPEEKAKQLSELENKYKKAIKAVNDAAKEAAAATGKSWEDWIGKALDKIFGKGTWATYGETVKQAFASMTAMTQSFNQLAQAESELRLARLERQYDREISMAEGNNRKIRALERKKEKEAARIKAEAQRKEFAQQVMNAISSTALAAINAYASASKIAWWLGPVAAGMALAAGAVQVAAIKKQQEASEAKGFAEGGFTPAGPKDKPVGVVHAGEWVASQRLLADPVARPMIDALDYAQRNNTLGSLRPADVSRSVTAPAVIAGAASDGQTEQLMVAVAAALGNYDGTMARLTDRLNEPFVTVNTVTGDMGIKEAQDEYQRLMNNTLPKSKRK